MPEADWVSQDPLIYQFEIAPANDSDAIKVNWSPTPTNYNSCTDLVGGVTSDQLGEVVSGLPEGTPPSDGDVMFLDTAQSAKHTFGFTDNPDDESNELTVAGISFTLQAIDDWDGAYNGGDQWASGFAAYVNSDPDNLGFTAAGLISCAVDGDNNTLVVLTHEAGAAGNSGYSSSDPNVWTAPWVKVESAGTDAANVSDLAPVALLAEASGTYWQSISNPNIKINVNDWDVGGYSFLIVNDEAALYGHSGYAATPNLVTTWAVVDGQSPAPTVSLLGADATLKRCSVEIGRAHV